MPGIGVGTALRKPARVTAASDEHAVPTGNVLALGRLDTMRLLDLCVLGAGSSTVNAETYLAAQPVAPEHAAMMPGEAVCRVADPPVRRWPRRLKRCGAPTDVGERSDQGVRRLRTSWRAHHAIDDFKRGF